MVYQEPDSDSEMLEEHESYLVAVTAVELGHKLWRITNAVHKMWRITWHWEDGTADWSDVQATSKKQAIRKANKNIRPIPEDVLE